MTETELVVNWVTNHPNAVVVIAAACLGLIAWGAYLCGRED